MDYDAILYFPGTLNNWAGGEPSLMSTPTCGACVYTLYGTDTCSGAQCTFASFSAAPRTSPGQVAAHSLQGHWRVCLIAKVGAAASTQWRGSRQSVMLPPCSELEPAGGLGRFLPILCTTHASLSLPLPLSVRASWPNFPYFPSSYLCLLFIE